MFLHKLVVGMLLLTFSRACAGQITHTEVTVEDNQSITGQKTFTPGATLGPVLFANLNITPSQVNGTIVEVLDASPTTPCTGGGTGALAVRINGAWQCNGFGGLGAFVQLNPITTQTITGAFPLVLPNQGASIGIGTSTITSGNQLEIHSNTQTLASTFSHVTGLPPPVGTTNGPAPIIATYFSRGTQASPAVVQFAVGGDPLGEFALGGYDGTNYKIAAGIEGIVLDSWTSTTHGAALQVYATKSGDNNMQEVFRFGQRGNLVGQFANVSNIDVGISDVKVLGWTSTNLAGPPGFDTGLSRPSGQPGLLKVGNGTYNDASAILMAGLFATGTNCSQNTASPAACGSATSGSFVIPTTTTSYVVNSTNVGAHSRIVILPTTDPSDLPSSPTCNAPAAGFAGESSRVAGTSFTMTLPSTTGTTCWIYWIVNQ